MKIKFILHKNYNIKLTKRNSRGAGWSINEQELSLGLNIEKLMRLRILLFLENKITNDGRMKIDIE